VSKLSYPGQIEKTYSTCWLPNKQAIGNSFAIAGVWNSPSLSLRQSSEEDSFYLIPFLIEIAIDAMEIFMLGLALTDI
jgi:hypothetical protein